MTEARDYIERLKNRDQMAYRELIEEYSNKLLRIAYYIVKDQEMAEDIVQESLISIYKNIDGFRGDSQLSTWLTRVVINNAKRVVGKKRVINFFPLKDLLIKDHKPLPHEVVIKKEKEEVLKEILMSLPVKYKEVLVLYFYEELKIKEISEILDISESGIKSRLKRGKEKIRLEMERRALNL
ncbi:RNA polymerase sigma factor [Alkaliphilus serpentinus]|uniref:RNA polymerase sigma factor n=1 Tax=Alkaliphilus serpentinus TaxID=1482731 RepID=A0A833M980_9FIRM|nr:RNA polymerase sigma factor [Alkaliphilus serpentinus]KAB3529206.1 RNA polymerase sigma factor [Alkaliphilus serpentinus]